MFDLKQTGSIDIHEFSSLFKYINDWKSLFERIDTDRSGFIEEHELKQGKFYICVAEEKWQRKRRIILTARQANYF